MIEENKYQKIHRYLKQQIDLKQYKPGARVPSEIDLASMFDVSRMTARKAIEQLVSENYLYQIPRGGTYVTNHQEKTIIHLEDNILSQRSTSNLTSTKVVDFRILKGSETSNTKFPKTELLYSFSRERYVGEKLFAYEESLIPCRHLFLDEKLLTGSLTDLFSQNNLLIEKIKKEYTAVIPENRIKKVFTNFGKGALLRVDFLRYLKDGDLLEANSVYYNQNECRFIQVIEK